MARDIARILGANGRADGYLYGNNYVVTWALGHLVHFAEPNEYGGNWASRWSFQQLPMIPKTWLLKPIQRVESQLRIVEKLLNAAETTELICATDAGREGENIFRLIYEHTGCCKPFKRLWVSSLTDEALNEGLAQLHPGHVFDDLARAARARAQADWLVGLNMTRAYTVRNGALYTIGRVQTPTLAMIVARELLITQFEKVFYFEIEASFELGFQAKYLHSDVAGKDTRIDAKAQAERLHQRFAAQATGTVASVVKKIKKLKPPQLYDLITLQKDGNRRFSLTASETLVVAQQLYEKYKLITYPRTESRHISEDMLGQLPRILGALNHPMAPVALARLKAGLKLSKNYVDKTKLSDHHGIIPTPKRPPNNLPRDLNSIYQMVVTRFVSIFLPDHVLEETTVLVDIDKGIFRARGATVQQEGWKEAEPKRLGGKGEQVRALPALSKNQIVQIQKMELLEKETAPPKRFTDASLLTAMKNAGREVDDDALAAVMKEQGLGTPATRAEMIEKLIRIHLIERRKKVLFPTEKGMALISVVHGKLKSPELTGKWEQKLKDVERGEYDADRFNASIVAFVEKIIPQVASSPVLSHRDPDRHAPSEPKLQQHSSPVKRSSASKKSEFGHCPRCGKGNIIEGRQAYGCNQYRSGCVFNFPKQVSGKKLTVKQVRDLANKRKTSLIKGFKDPANVAFSGRLVLDADLNLQLQPELPDYQTIDQSCPRCGLGHIMEGNRGFGCNRFREGCDFVIWKEFSGKKLTLTQIKALLKRGKTSKIKGFKDAQGNSFEGRLFLDSARNVQLTRGLETGKKR